jgi:hypothetical protein
MRRIAVPAAVLALLVAAPGAEARVRCGSGTTAFVQGDLRIFGVHFRTPDEFGFNEYACLGGRRPLLVGSSGGSSGLASSDTPAYAIGGGRYLAAYETSDGEGGPSAAVTVKDLRARRTVAFLDLACCEGVPAFRVSREGTLVVLAPGEGLVVKPRGRRVQVLAAPDAAPRDLAMWGSTVYWTEGSTARAATVAGNVLDGDAMLEPVRMRRRGGACAAARGRTIAASGSVRVIERGERRFACRIGRPGRFDAFSTTRPQIAGDRWLLLRGEGSARVVDARTGRAVTVLDDGVAQSALLRDGTFAWLDFGGRLLARTPGSPPVELAPASAAPSPPAAARRAVYWTENGVPRRYRPVSAARSASKPG